MPVMWMLTSLLLTAMRALRATFMVSGAACVSLSSSASGAGCLLTCGFGNGVARGAVLAGGAGDTFTFGGCGVGCGVSCARATAPQPTAIAKVKIVNVLLNIVVSGQRPVVSGWRQANPAAGH